MFLGLNKQTTKKHTKQTAYIYNRIRYPKKAEGKEPKEITTKKDGVSFTEEEAMLPYKRVLNTESQDTPLLLPRQLQVRSRTCTYQNNLYQ